MSAASNADLDEAVNKTLYSLFSDALKLLSAGVNQQRKAARMDELVKYHLLRVLDACNQNQTHAAEILGIDRRTLQRNLDDIQPHRKKRHTRPLDLAQLTKLREKGASWSLIAKKLKFPVSVLRRRLLHSQTYSIKRHGLPQSPPKRR